MAGTKPKKVRCTCKRCGKVNYFPETDVDVTEPYLCAKCDDQFIVWQNAARSTVDEKYRTLEAFLARRPQR